MTRVIAGGIPRVPRRLLHHLGSLQRHRFDLVVLRERRDLGVAVDLRCVTAAHRTVSLENDAFLDDETRGGDVAEELARGTNLDTLARGDVASDLAGDDDRAA